MLSTFPSYTQLGMAALLPHQNLAFADGDKVLVDDAPFDTTERRARLLAAFHACSGGPGRGHSS
ncbi:MAG: PglZ domain-containing protein [Propionibacteriaceae bacterium]|jgi:hypothetical protein|nr:PglZ domain-containing protein [Propionibacteriaceae bacterium]